MQVSTKREATGGHAKRRATADMALSAAALVVTLIAATPAHAVDGCVVLLCLAAPSWHAIPQCVPPIKRLFRDLARGKGFPTCAMSGTGNNSSHEWASAPDQCPPQYTRQSDGPNGPVFSCDYSGAVAVNVNGMAWTRTWWNLDGGSVTEFTPAARQSLAIWDRKFDEDYDAWFSAQPPVVPPCLTC